MNTRPSTNRNSPYDSNGYETTVINKNFARQSGGRHDLDATVNTRRIGSAQHDHGALATNNYHFNLARDVLNEPAVSILFDDQLNGTSGSGLHAESVLHLDSRTRHNGPGSDSLRRILVASHEVNLTTPIFSGNNFNRTLTNTTATSQPSSSTPCAQSSLHQTLTSSHTSSGSETDYPVDIRVRVGTQISPGTKVESTEKRYSHSGTFSDWKEREDERILEHTTGSTIDTDSRLLESNYNEVEFAHNQDLSLQSRMLHTSSTNDQVPQNHSLNYNSGELPGLEMGYARSNNSTPWNTVGHGKNKRTMEEETMRREGGTAEEEKTSSPLPPTAIITEDAENDTSHESHDGINTPLTVSTAPSTADEVSLEGKDGFQLPASKLDVLLGTPSTTHSEHSGSGWLGAPVDGVEDHPSVWFEAKQDQSVPSALFPSFTPGNCPQLTPRPNHRRAQSWEESFSTSPLPPVRRPVSAEVGKNLSSYEYHGHSHGSQHFPAMSQGPSQGATNLAAFQQPQLYERVGDGGTPLSSPSLSPKQGALSSTEYHHGDVRALRGVHVPPFRPSSVGPDNKPHISGQAPRYRERFPYQQPQSQQQQQQHHRQLLQPYPQSSYGQQRAGSPYRVRNPRQPPHAPQRQHSAPGYGGGSGSSGPSSRSTAEVLKTLLRKKACLYEAETSMAVSLVTWLVGRELALQYGYFSRQQLQSGVHAVVTEKIEAGTITRTKVNRCMQIILNSCFHYIIPRPDGSEEKGDLFRAAFAKRASDDSHLLSTLSAPWGNLKIDTETVVRATATDGQAGAKKSGSASSPEGSPSLKGKERKETGEEKRAVLLCFNENVRSAHDVIKCHNEFIRDTAIASKLHLSSQDWKTFFGTGRAWTGTGRSGQKVPSRQIADTVGILEGDDLAEFRTSWCSKRYEHKPVLCAFSHVDISGGWLRRDPTVYKYADKMCPKITLLSVPDVSPVTVNACPKGVSCEYAHSREELEYHPNRYKKTPCPNQDRGGMCPKGDICPYLHTRWLHDTSSGKQGRPVHLPSAGVQSSSASKSGFGRGPSLPPDGSPILYIDPAPISAFELHLSTPGLRGLFRRHCAVLHAHNSSDTHYSAFGDDWGFKKKREVCHWEKKAIRRRG